MKWMEHFLSSGEIAGKITCPNKKCSAKLGNFDWAGVCCGCKEWVTPVRFLIFPSLSSQEAKFAAGFLHQSLQGRRSAVKLDALWIDNPLFSYH